MFALLLPAAGSGPALFAQERPAADDAVPNGTWTMTVRDRVGGEPRGEPRSQPERLRVIRPRVTAHPADAPGRARPAGGVVVGTRHDITGWAGGFVLMSERR